MVRRGGRLLPLPESGFLLGLKLVGRSSSLGSASICTTPACCSLNKTVGARFLAPTIKSFSIRAITA